MKTRNIKNCSAKTAEQFCILHTQHGIAYQLVAGALRDRFKCGFVRNYAGKSMDAAAHRYRRRFRNLSSQHGPWAWPALIAVAPGWLTKLLNVSLNAVDGAG